MKGRDFIAGLVMGGLIGMGSAEVKNKLAHEKRYKDRKTETIHTTSLPNFSGFEDERYHYYDRYIINLVTNLNEHFKDFSNYKPLDNELVKSIIMQESSYEESMYVFLHDPMRIADKDKNRLDILQGLDLYKRLKVEDTSLKFKRYKKTPLENGILTYDNGYFIKGEDSVLGGIFLLYDSFFRNKDWRNAVSEYSSNPKSAYTKEVFDRINQE